MDQTPAVRRIVEAMMERALARCDQQGIAWEDFYKVLLDVQQARPELSVSGLVDQTFRRLADRAN